ncbi:hypothetical protein VTK56DRAFT_7128 [Thermocarpiscus australiensis]
MPPGEAYDSQGQPQHQQLQQLQPLQQPQQQQWPPQQPGPQAPPHAHDANRYPNGSQPYQHQQHGQQYQPQPVQYVHPSYAQQPAQYYSGSTPQYSNYNGVFHQRAPHPAPAHTPAQFVHPSYVQQGPAATPAGQVLQMSQPATTMSPQLPAAAHLHEHQAPFAKSSPKLEDRRPSTQGKSAKELARNPRRLSSSAGVTKSNATPQLSSHLETLPLLLLVAEDCFEKANAAAQQVARSMTAGEVAEHHKLMATGLGCLEVALKSNKLWPRLEARLCLRYAGILVEETTNIMDAETTLTRGIAVCEKHRFIDLKYCSQFLLIKTLFQRNQKAALKSIEGHIADCTTYSHVHWIYAFRFLKAAFHFQSGTAADHHSVENLRKIAGIANHRGDKAIFVVAMLLEGLAHLSTMKDDWATRVQMCIAQASKLQLDDSVHIPQTDVLLLLLDLACSLHQKNHQMSAQKLSALQRRLEELKQSPDWPSRPGKLLLPINKMHNAHQTISNDTRAILRPGGDEVDYLVLSALGKQEAWALTYVFNGVVAHYKASTPGRSSSIWGEAVRLLEDNKPLALPHSLPEALKHAEWARELACYAHILIGLQSSTLSDWAKVKTCLIAVQEHQPSTDCLEVLTLYLEGVFYQGIAQLEQALEIWKDKRFEMDWSGAPKAGSRIKTELSILATLNRLWIMQDPRLVDDAEVAELLDLLRPICEDNPDQEIQTVYNLVLASIRQNPPLSINQVKRHIHQALTGSQQTNNTQHLSIALNIMRCRLFENVVGEQALKSAKAASTQARKSGNLLWMSVAEGMLAQNYEMQGAIDESRATFESGVRLANEAYRKTLVL